MKELYVVKCKECHKLNETEVLPMVGFIYECAMCGTLTRIIRIYLCKKCDDIHIQGETYYDSTGWVITK